jgi:hypothetical protein
VEGRATVRLVSRNQVDHTRRFPELAPAVAKLRPDVLVLDGEVAVFDDQLVSRFGLLGEPDPAVLCTPPMLIAFRRPPGRLSRCPPTRSQTAPGGPGGLDRGLRDGVARPSARTLGCAGLADGRAARPGGLRRQGPGLHVPPGADAIVGQGEASPRGRLHRGRYSRRRRVRRRAGGRTGRW